MKKKFEQIPLFDFLPEDKTTKTLIIGKQTAKILSKTQQTFNRLSKKIETIQEKMQADTKVLNESLQFYGKMIYPLEQEALTSRKDVIKLLYKFYVDKKFIGKMGKTKRKIFKNVIRVQLENILYTDKNEPDEEIKKIYQTIFGTSFDAAKDEDFFEMLDEMESMFSNMGMDVDLSDIDKNATEEEIFRKMAEIKKNFEEEQGNKDEQKKKTKKQLEREASDKQIEDSHNRNISTIYKQLARVLHPDLEQDVKAKEEKESLMKQLTSAYKNKDLYTLLRLEIEWIHKENKHLETLSEEKLETYNRLLKQQIKELEEEHELLLSHPRYFPLKDLFQYGCLPNITLLNSKKNQLKKIISMMNGSIERLKGDNPLAELSDIIYIFGDINS